MKMLILLAGLLVHGIAIAQTAAEQGAGLAYTYAELRFVDVDNNMRHHKVPFSPNPCSAARFDPVVTFSKTPSPREATATPGPRLA